MSAEKRVAELGLDLSKVPTPIANYVPSVRTGNLVFLSGQGPTKPEGGMVTGKLGRDISIEEGYAAARLVAIGLLSALRAEIGSLDRVTRVVKLLGMVNGTTDFTDQPAVRKRRVRPARRHIRRPRKARQISRGNGQLAHGHFG